VSIGHLLDHTCRVWRATEAQGEYHETVRSFVVAHDALPCGKRRRRAALVPGPGGQTPTGGVVLYFDVGPTLRDRDVVELYAGPDAPAVPRTKAGRVQGGAFEIESSTAPRGHHIEASAVLWHGELPEVEAS
jgi:hypothetical protein